MITFIENIPENIIGLKYESEVTARIMNLLFFRPWKGHQRKVKTLKYFAS